MVGLGPFCHRGSRGMKQRAGCWARLGRRVLNRSFVQVGPTRTLQEPAGVLPSPVCTLMTRGLPGASQAQMQSVRCKD